MRWVERDANDPVEVGGTVRRRHDHDAGGPGLLDRGDQVRRGPEPRGADQGCRLGEPAEVPADVQPELRVLGEQLDQRLRLLVVAHQHDAPPVPPPATLDAQPVPEPGATGDQRGEADRGVPRHAPLGDVEAEHGAGREGCDGRRDRHPHELGPLHERTAQ